MKFKKKGYNVKQYGKRGRGEWDQFLKKLCIAIQFSLKECIALIKKYFRPTQNNYEVYKQVIKDVGKSDYLQLNKPNVKLLIGGDKTNNTILIKNK